MLNMGFIDKVEAIIQELSLNRVTMVFSATLPKDVEKLCHEYMKDPDSNRDGFFWNDDRYH